MSWLVKHLCLGREVSWAITKTRILMSDFIIEAKIWFTIMQQGLSHHQPEKCPEYACSDGGLALEQHSFECWLLCAN